jgi:tetratricopeptide (TPR) repeat protein
MEGRLPKRPDLLQERAPNPNEGIRVEKIDFQTVLPVFRNWYDTNPIGTAVLVNQEKVSITGLRANLKVAVNEKTTSSKELEVPATLKPGEKVVVNLYALLDQKVMEITEEGERKPAELVLTYNVGEQRFRDVKTPTVIFWNRNNMTWDDNRRAAAFVTVNDPRVTELAGTVLKLVDPLQTVAINKPLVAAMAVHQATILNGVKYQQDPKSKYEDLSKQKNQVDYLKYPAQTLMSSGDCDDLSILYAALLEACSIDTAFVTVPGHILIAFALPVAESEVQKNYYDSDMIFRFNDRFWVPLETIKRELSFTNAWKTGAATWKQYEDNPDFGVYPLDEAWLVYNRVQAPENLLASSTIRLPEQKPIEAAVKREIDAFKASELDPLVKKLEKDPRGPTDPSIVNKIGVLYAKYGEWDKAESAFKRITSMKENSATFSAHLNLGNTFYLRGRYTEALASYQQALKRTPSSTIAQINVARASYALNKFDDARSVYEKLAVSDPQLAAQFAYLGSKAGNTGERAGDSAAQKGVTIWDD